MLCAQLNLTIMVLVRAFIHASKAQIVQTVNMLVLNQL